MHFCIFVLVPPEIFNKGDKEIKDFIGKKMERYHDEYKLPIPVKHYLDEWEYKDESIQNILKNCLPDPKFDLGTLPEILKKIFEEWGVSEEECAKTHPPGVDLEGIYYHTTANDNAQWDWYRVGGRWDGYITNNPQESENGFNFDGKHETIENNNILVSKLPNDKIPYGLVLPNDEWLDKDSSGNWRNLFEESLAKFTDHYIVSLDCHN